jgi:hypothetical protein
VREPQCALAIVKLASQSAGRPLIPGENRPTTGQRVCDRLGQSDARIHRAVIRCVVMEKVTARP